MKGDSKERLTNREDLEISIQTMKHYQNRVSSTFDTFCNHQNRNSLEEIQKQIEDEFL